MTITISSGVNSGNINYNGVLNVLQGGSVFSTTVLPGGSAVIAGHANVTTVNSGGTVSVTNGGVVTGTTILSGAVQSVMNGGEALNTVVAAGGSETFASGAIVQSGLVSSGGTEVFVVGAQLIHETVLAGATLIESGLMLGSAMTLDTLAVSETFTINGARLTGIVGTVGATVAAGGVLSVTANTTDSGTTIGTGGQLFDAGGTVLGDTIDSGGVMTVSAGRVGGTTVAGQLNVLNTGLDSASVVSGSGASEVGSGGILPPASIPRLVGDTIEAGGHLFVEFLAIASATNVASGGTVDVTSGGDLTSAVVGSAGFVNVSAGGAAIGTTVSAGGVVYVSGGGTASATTVLSGGNEVVLDGGLSLSAIINSGGNQGVLNGGTSELATVTAGGILAFVVGATLNTDTLNVGATLSENGVALTSGMSLTVAGVTDGPVGELLKGPQGLAGLVAAVFASVGNGASLVVSAGGTDLDGTVGSGGTLRVVAGNASNTQVDGGTLVVSGGMVVNAVLNSGFANVVGGTLGGASAIAGSLTIGATGNGISTTVTGSAQEVVSGNTRYDIVSSGGFVLVAGHGQFGDALVASGGSATVQSGGSVDRLVVGAGGSANLLSGTQMLGNTTIDGGGTLNLQAGVRAQTLTFSGTSGVLMDGETQLHAYAGNISGFAIGDTIDLSNVAYNSGGTATLVGLNTVNVVENGATHELQFAQPLTGDSFTLSSDGVTGTDVMMTLLCFVEGTRIATPSGEVAVEQLRVGDTVRLARGGSAPVAWLGRRAVDPRRHPRPLDVQPVRVRAHAFGPGLPTRDLRLSPDHAVYADGVLIPVRYLVNGDSVAREAGGASATYWHIELPAHDVVLAEGLPCESYLDTGNRAAFENAGTVMQTHPDFSQRLWDADACAPLVIAGPQLDRVRARLYARTLLPRSGSAVDRVARRRAC